MSSEWMIAVKFGSSKVLVVKINLIINFNLILNDDSIFMVSTLKYPLFWIYKMRRIYEYPHKACVIVTV
jgi:hypothetical protein